MKQKVLDQIQDHGPQTVYEIADRLQLDVYDVSTVAVELMDEDKLYLETADGTLWYLEQS